VVEEPVCIGGRMLPRKREDGVGRVFDGANETGRSVSCARREGLWSKSLSWSGSYEPSPGSGVSARCDYMDATLGTQDDIPSR
jgi:hypothetical protein